MYRPNVLELLGELRISRDLEALDQVRFESVGLPDSQHRGVADAGLPGERARAPVCRSFGRGLRRQAHDLSSIDARLAPTARQVIFYRHDAALNKAFTPAPHLDSPDSQRGGNFPIAHTIRRQQHDLCSSHCSYLEGL